MAKPTTRYTKDFKDVLLEAVIDFISYTDVKEISDLIYTTDSSNVINDKLNLKTQEDFENYIKAALAKPMKQAEMAMDQIVRTIMGTLLRRDRKELVSFVQKYYDSSFTGQI